VIIDVHHHLWRRSRGDYDWLTPELGPLWADFEPTDVEPLLAAAGVGGTVLVQAAPTEAETRHLLEIARARPWVLGVVGWTDLTTPDVVERIAALGEAGPLVGVRPMIQDEPDPNWMLRLDVSQGLAAVAETSLAFDALVRPAQLKTLVRLVDAHQSLIIVLDHAGKPDIARGAFQPWADDVAALAKRPNVTCKISGLLTEAGASKSDGDLRPYVDHLLATFGPERLMWGSDWPVVLLAGDYQGWAVQSRRLIAGLTETEQAAVLGGTARRVYRLKETA
jgi:L-fuconolactonase